MHEDRGELLDHVQRRENQFDLIVFFVVLFETIAEWTVDHRRERF